MRLCIRCKRVSPKNALFCISCGDAFGGTRCVNGHLTPGLGRIAHCPVCRSSSLVPATGSLNFSLLTRIIAWVFGLCALKWVLANLHIVWLLAVTFIQWLIAPSIIAIVWSVLSLVLVLKLFVWCIGLFDADYAKRLDPLPKLLPWLWKTSVSVCTTIARILYRVVEGKALPGKKKAKKAKGDEEKA